MKSMYKVVFALSALSAFTLAGCDALDDEPTRELIKPTTPLPTQPLNAPEELELDDDDISWSEDLSDSPDPASGPAGKTCCVNCGDGWNGWWDLGTGDNCNYRAAKWCHDHNWSLIDATWC